MSPALSQNPRGRRSWHQFFTLAPVLLIAMAPSPSAAQEGSPEVDLMRGDSAPPISVRSTDGNPVNLDDLRGRAVLLTFLQTGQEKCEEARTLVSEMLRESGLHREPVTWMIVLSKASDPVRIEQEPDDETPPIVIHDTGRSLFQMYDIIVLPSAVVIDRDGRIAHVMHGLTNRFGDETEDAIRFALGRIDEVEFDRLIHPTAEAPPTETELRASRTLHLAERLAARGMTSMAEEKFREAIALAPESDAARVGLGFLFLDAKRLDEAETEFREALARAPESTDAAIGAATVCAHRGGTALAEGESMLRELIERHPSEPRAHFVLGLILEAQGVRDEALQCFKTAASILLQRARSAAADDDHAGN